MSFMTFFTVLKVGFIQTNCYIFSDGDECIVIDPGAADPNIVAKIKELSQNPKVSILLTHCHADHFMGTDYLLENFPGSKVYATKEDQPYLFDSNKNCAKMFNVEIVLKDKSTLQTIHDGQILPFGKYNIEVIATPGHTPGGVIFVLRDQKTVFSGDSLFNNGVGRSDLPGGNSAVLQNSLKTKILTLPSDFKVYPGHGPSTTIGYEKRNLEWLSNIF